MSFVFIKMDDECVNTMFADDRNGPWGTLRRKTGAIVTWDEFVDAPVSSLSDAGIDPRVGFAWSYDHDDFTAVLDPIEPTRRWKPGTRPVPDTLALRVNTDYKGRFEQFYVEHSHGYGVWDSGSLPPDEARDAARKIVALFEHLDRPLVVECDLDATYWS